MKKIFFLLTSLLIFSACIAQNEIPAVYTNIINENGKNYLKYKGKKIPIEKKKGLSLSDLEGNPTAGKKSISLDFNMLNLNGTLFFGLIKTDDGQYPLPVFFKKSAKIEAGKTKIKIVKYLTGKYDMTDWQKKGKGLLGYRVQNSKGELLYGGRIGFTYSPEKGIGIDNTIIEGPFVTMLNSNGATIFFTTNFNLKCSVVVGDKTFTDQVASTNHEIKISGLKSATKYTYEVEYGENSLKYNFKTAPKNGSRKPFVFAYASDSRGNNGGGERNFYGSNAYMTKKIAALARFEKAAFMQFTGDLVSGYVNSVPDINLQYANWKRCVEPFWHYFPIISTTGNHEVVTKAFQYKEGKYISVDNFPFESVSEEAVFAKNFVNLVSDLKSEDGSKYDPDPNKIDFPPYNETVFTYTYDNVAIIVLNSNYLYSPSLKKKGEITGGNLHAYIMDNQLAWLKKTLTYYEKDKNIDHVFITLHTPAFPNGGHSGDDMWYNGDNSKRPIIAGKPVDKGIIERRDEILDMVINQSKKTVAFLTGDEHNFNVMTIDSTTNIYPQVWDKNKLKIKRTFYQINNGAAGAPYYAQEKLPWSGQVEGFTTQNALVLIYVNGKHLKMKVLNPDTLDIILEKQLR